MDSPETQSAFLDIASNLLAVILILTLFALLAAPHRSSSDAHPLAKASSEPRFVAPRRELFPPFSAYYFVLDGRVARWNQEAVVSALLAAPERRAGTTDQGRYEWMPDQLVTRDIDGFRIRFFPDAAALTAGTPPFAPADSERLIAELRAAHADTRTSPVFIVHPAGMETFVPLHARLQAEGIRFRWFARQPEEPLFLGRTPEQFTDFAIYW